MLKKLLREALAFKAQIDEIDWEKTFSDVQKTCVPIKDVVEYLNKVKANAEVGYGEREKFHKGMPFVHSKSSFLKKDEPIVDIEYFIKEMTKKPNNVVNTNEKILNSGGPHEFVYKTGLPALRGIAYDIDKGEFIYVNTCPGAGDCIAICYAMKGRYIQYPAAYDSMTRRLNYLLNYPEKYEEQMYEELKAKAIEHKALKGYKAKLILRWNDSGDFFAKKYVQIAENVMERLDNEGYNVKSYAYTKMGDVAKDEKKFQTTFSLGGKKKEGEKIDLTKNKLSLVVPKKLFADLDFMKVDDEKKLKDRVADFYKLDINSVITYDEMMKMPEGKDKKWSVIVTPEDGDDAAFRDDIKNILLTIH